MLVLDSSNSMWGRFEGDTRGVIAGQVLNEALKKREGAVSLGLISYGHRSKTSCQDIEVILPVGPIDATAFGSALDRLRPQGRTPISHALTTAMQELKAGTEPSATVLLADGLDNCGPDPCAAAAALKAASPGLSIHVVALDVPEEDQPKLACIATNTGGSFAAAGSRNELVAALDTAFELAASPPPAGARTVSTQTGPETALDSPMSTEAAEAARILGISPQVPEPAVVKPSKRWARFVAPIPRPNPRAADWPPAPEVVAAVDQSPEESPVQEPEVQPAAAEDSQPAPPDPLPAEGMAMLQPAESTGAPEPDGASQSEITGAITEAPSAEPGKIEPRAIDIGDRELRMIPNAIRPAYLVAEQIVDAGQEAIRLRARIAAGTEAITRPVQWTVHKVEEAPEDKWPLIGERAEPETTFDLGPGEYVVRAAYGAIKAAKVLLVQPNQKVDVTFILNGGGLRVHQALAFLDPPQGVHIKHWVFEPEADGTGRRHLFAESDRPGEVLRLNAGTYHLISRFGDANAVVETDITIKPGMLTEVEVNHKAGIVHLGFSRHDTDGPPGVVSWQISDNAGTVVFRAEGSRISEVLAPGEYSAMVEYNGRKFEKKFTVEIGETKDVSVTTN